MSPATIDSAFTRLRADGLDLAVYSSGATRIELCLEEPAGGERRLGLDRDGDLWRGHVDGVEPGRRYGLRAHGPYDPAAGHRFDPSQRLLDPYARAVDGRWSVALPDPEPARRLARPWRDTVIYEAHVRGLTRLDPRVPPALRGTYAALAHPAVIGDLRDLGVTTLELMPVAEFRTEAALRARGGHNYWGYSPVAFLAPHAAYAASGPHGGQVAELRGAVEALHAARIEVLVDVVFNHTGEGGPADPAWSLRGLDNHTYYRADPADPARYRDVTGTGNTVDAGHPVVIRLVVDALRHWVTTFGIDGFRFDLAVALGRAGDDFDPHAPLLQAITTDELLSQVKLIAEPWDLGHDGYRLGGFASPFAEWNGLFRDTTREFWRGRATTGELARAFAGSSDVFGPSGRGPLASVNFVASHDGFTLRDLVSYDAKHNLANGEDNRDGDDANHSWNSGVEGDTDDPEVIDLRRRRVRGMLATVLLSAGVPMFQAGDERGRTQQGNNNAYCQDSPLAWLAPAGDDELRALVRELIALRAARPELRRDRFFVGDTGDGEPADIRWFAPDGHVMDSAWWQAADARTLGLLLDGELFIVFHGGPHSVDVMLPPSLDGFELLLDTIEARAGGPFHETLAVAPWSVVVLSRRGTISPTLDK
jgi:glycogen operon protein